MHSGHAAMLRYLLSLLEPLLVSYPVCLTAPLQATDRVLQTHHKTVLLSYHCVAQDAYSRLDPDLAWEVRD